MSQDVAFTLKLFQSEFGQNPKSANQIAVNKQDSVAYYSTKHCRMSVATFGLYFDEEWVLGQSIIDFNALGAFS